ncbi:MAG: ubiquitin-conjugating enzyme E2 [Harvfovirus sp.]|uniref:E2 ubiquitin-conjugating enzyme n=1 Tax=Harvfovirus sp. TaxID=2487768 RepID=A0A3G5A217_9VIRU|nr:MAG: ubiquitin-conjugating enzyme E2 [Harvfovirus sp.]
MKSGVVNPLVVSTITRKRLIGELKMLQKEPLELIDTYPDDKDSLLWYFLLRGPEDSEYKGGFFIGKVLHNPEYPIKAPDFMMLTPTGRFEIEKKICLTNSGYHAETWSAVWNMKTILLGFLSIMADDTTHGISHIHESKPMRKAHAEESVRYNMKYHKDVWLRFDRFVKMDGSVRSSEEIKLLSSPKKIVTVVQPAEVKVEVKAVEVKAVEVKPVEVKPVEVKPVEVKPVEVKPVEVAEEPKPKRGRKKNVDSGKIIVKGKAKKAAKKPAVVPPKKKEPVPQPFNQLKVPPQEKIE